MKKTYTVTMNNETCVIVHTYSACNAIFAMVKAVIQFAHLGAKFSTIAKVERN